MTTLINPSVIAGIKSGLYENVNAVVDMVNLDISPLIKEPALFVSLKNTFVLAVYNHYGIGGLDQVSLNFHHELVASVQLISDCMMNYHGALLIPAYADLTDATQVAVLRFALMMVLDAVGQL